MIPGIGIPGKLKNDNKGKVMKLKFLVLGSKGMLGYAVTEYLKQNGHDVVPICRSEFDIAKDPLDNFLNKNSIF